MICCKWFLNKKAFQFVFWSEFTRCSLLLIFDMLGFHLWHIFLNAALLHMPPILVWKHGFLGKGFPDAWSTEILAYQRQDFFLVGGGVRCFLIQLLYREIPGSPCFHHFYMLNYVNSLWMKLNTSFFFFRKYGFKNIVQKEPGPMFYENDGVADLQGFVYITWKGIWRMGPPLNPWWRQGVSEKSWFSSVAKCCCNESIRSVTVWPLDQLPTISGSFIGLKGFLFHRHWLASLKSKDARKNRMKSSHSIYGDDCIFTH